MLWPITLLSALLSQLPLGPDEPLWLAPALVWQDPGRARLPLQFALGIMAVLTAHELGHLVAARAYRVACGWPLFVPAPSLFGTLGAVLPMHSPPPHKTALVRISIMGPLFGLAVAAPLYVWGQRVGAHVHTPDTLQVGASGLTWALDGAWGRPGGALGPGHGLHLPPVALAGWLGLFHTGLNLLPVGQTDGGHLAYALLGRRHRLWSWGVVVALGAAAWATLLGAETCMPGPGRWPSQLVWPTVAALQLAAGLSHSATLDDGRPLGPLDRALCALGAAVALGTWVYRPILGT